MLKSGKMGETTNIVNFKCLTKCGKNNYSVENRVIQKN